MELPLHIACRRGASSEVVQRLIDAYPAAAAEMTSATHDDPIVSRCFN